VTICEGLRAEVLSRGIPAERITVAPNSVDLRRFSVAAARDENLAAQLRLVAHKTFGFIGSFFPFEGLDVLIRAVPGILAREPLARFLIVGDGPDAERVKALTRQLGVQEAVTFTGRVPHSEVERYYGLVDVLIYPRVSKRVTELVTPLKPLEAMAQGKLVVASNVGGHREMVFAEQNGVLFEAGNPDALAAACIDLLARPETWAAMKANGKSYVESARSWEKNIEIYDHLYKRFHG
jgi:glycosyltransferase involved in cell wall biosynthesis